MYLIANQVTQLYITLMSEINMNSGALACSSLSCLVRMHCIRRSEYGKFGQALQCHNILMAILIAIKIV